MRICKPCCLIKYPGYENWTERQFITQSVISAECSQCKMPATCITMEDNKSKKKKALWENTTTSDLRTIDWREIADQWTTGGTITYRQERPTYSNAGNYTDGTTR